MWQIDQVTLRLFIAVCEEGTIARAAEREFIAPSAVSKRLADLEALVDVALLSRSQRGTDQDRFHHLLASIRC
ncbi:helix-turn-helix domain-containing protein, partial [Paraburkholderia dipogonis]|uniref:helix-turn-helix domain-containing protein n=1 Tax=Paraburkholderia dipogonis TaxID=1211383 RepID=UPI00361CF7C9